MASPLASEGLRLYCSERQLQAAFGKPGPAVPRPEVVLHPLTFGTVRGKASRRKIYHGCANAAEVGFAEFMVNRLRRPFQYGRKAPTPSGPD